MSISNGQRSGPWSLALQMLNIEGDRDDHNHGDVSGKLLLSFEGCDEEEVSWFRECELNMG